MCKISSHIVFVYKYRVIRLKCINNAISTLNVLNSCSIISPSAQRSFVVALYALVITWNNTIDCPVSIMNSSLEILETRRKFCGRQLLRVAGPDHARATRDCDLFALCRNRNKLVAERRRVSELGRHFISAKTTALTARSVGHPTLLRAGS